MAPSWWSGAFMPTRSPPARRSSYTGALTVHAYDRPETMLGQGTVGYEIERDAPDIDTLLVAVGGGGLIGGTPPGTAAAFASSGSSRKPRRPCTWHDRRPAGDAPAAASPPLAPRRLMFPIARDFVERRAGAGRGDQRRAAPAGDVLRLVAEPGGAAAVAACWRAVTGRSQTSGSRAAVRRQYRRVDFDRPAPDLAARRVLEKMLQRTAVHLQAAGGLERCGRTPKIRWICSQRTRSADIGSSGGSGVPPSWASSARSTASASAGFGR